MGTDGVAVEGCGIAHPRDVRVRSRLAKHHPAGYRFDIMMKAAAGLARRAVAAAIDLVLPAHCPACDEIVESDGAFCAACFRRAPFLIDPCCDACATPFASDGMAGTTSHCDPCTLHPPAWDRARAAFTYDAFSRRLILPLKYADRTENASVLGAHMARAGAPLLADADLIVPVPLHRARLRTRRYNQSVLLARAILRRMPPERAPILVPDGLVRLRATAPLALRSAGQRRQELAGAIGVRAAAAGRFAGARIVLVDDVLTTGSTATECARVLKQAGAADVSLLVAARTAPRAGAAASPCLETTGDEF